jgi:hypothetical protein
MRAGYGKERQEHENNILHTPRPTCNHNINVRSQEEFQEKQECTLADTTQKSGNTKGTQYKSKREIDIYLLSYN